MSKFKVAIVRGRYLNPFEMQSYIPLTQDYALTAFSSLTATTDSYPFPVQKLLSPLDISYWIKFIIPVRLSLGILNRIFVDSHMLWRLEECLRGFDVVHTADTHYCFTMQCLNAKRKGFVKKVVATIWENIPFNHETIRGRHELKQRAIREVDLFLATSTQAKDALIAEGCKSEKIRIVHPGIDLTRFNPKKNTPKKATRVLFVGRLVKEKGIWLVLEAFRQLYQKNQTLTLQICGEGEEKTRISQYIAAHRLSRSVRLRHADYFDMPEIYRNADVFLLASRPTKFWQEQFGMVLVEAMASGLPIVVTNCGSISEVVGNAGLLVDVKDPKDFKNAFEKILSDANLREKLRLAGIKRAKHQFDSEYTAQKIAQIYEEVMRHV